MPAHKTQSEPVSSSRVGGMNVELENECAGRFAIAKFFKSCCNERIFFNRLEPRFVGIVSRTVDFRFGRVV